MSIKSRMRSWLGITEIQEDQAMLNNHMIEQQTFIINGLRDIRKQVAITNDALGRFVAKVDPGFLKDPLSKEAREESNRIGEEAIRRIEAEHNARRHTEGKL